MAMSEVVSRIKGVRCTKHHTSRYKYGMLVRRKVTLGICPFYRKPVSRPLA